jgi:uncharacterized caspase-like protein
MLAALVGSYPFLRTTMRLSGVACITLLLFAIAGERRTVGAGIRSQVEGLNRDLYVLSIGINAYPKEGNIPNLLLADADAEAVAAAFSTKEVGVTFSHVHVTTLLDSSATLAGVRAALEHLISVCQPEDLVIFYFAGEGALLQPGSKTSSKETGAGEYHFIVFDSTIKAGDKTTLRNSLTARELSQLLLSIQAQRQVVIIDSSHSAAAFDSLRTALNSDSIFTLHYTGRRFALFGTEGNAIEFPSLGHGLMTSSLLDAMKSNSEIGRKGFITEADLEGYMMSHMGQLNVAVGGDEQLLSYSDLRGLCLSVTEISQGMNDCQASYGYDPHVHGPEMRGVEVEAPPVDERAANRGTDYALILAGDNYDHWRKLDNPIYDAQSLQKELVQNFGYAPQDIFLRENPTKRDIHDVLTELQHRTFGKNDRLLIYVAGHGFMDDFGEGFLITRETLLPAEDPDLGSGLDLSRFRSAIDQLPIPHILLVLDVCYGGSFKERKVIPAYSSESLDAPPSLDALIANKMKSVSRLYIASGGLRQAYDGNPGMHSPFARTFLKTLQQFGGNEHIIDMGRIDGAVYGLCPHPYYGTFGIQQEGGDFIFVPRPDAHPVADPGLDAKVEGPHCSS